MRLSSRYTKCGGEKYSGIIPTPKFYSIFHTYGRRGECSASSAGDGQRTLRAMVIHNPAYQELGWYPGLQELSDIIEAGTRRIEATGTTIPQLWGWGQSQLRGEGPIVQQAHPPKGMTIPDKAQQHQCIAQSNANSTDNGSPISEAEGNCTSKIVKSPRSGNWKQKKQLHKCFPKTNPMSHRCQIEARYNTHTKHAKGNSHIQDPAAKIVGPV